MKNIERKRKVVIKFTGDSGDGMQFAGGQFTSNTASEGYDFSTFPDFPAEIRAPQGTVAGVSGFQIQFGSDNIYTPGDSSDVLVAMNAAALKSNLKYLREGGILILNTSGLDLRNMRLAGYEAKSIDDLDLDPYTVYKIDITKLTREALAEFEIGVKDKDRARNMFVLGFLYWMYNRKSDHTIAFLKKKFGSDSTLAKANVKVLKAGYHFGDITETFTSRYSVHSGHKALGKYRNINGNHALALGLVVAARKAGLKLFYGSYPITPASDILHRLAGYKHLGAVTFQAEDEIAAAGAALGASFGGNLGVTGTSGPGLALKAEMIGLAVMLELPLVVINVQRGGPSTGLPTKTEQADLMQAMFGRNGESPLPVLAAHTPSSCFGIAFDAARFAVEHMTPVVLLTDGYIANGSELWEYPAATDLENIKTPLVEKNEKSFRPYKRDEKLVRQWAVPGTSGLEHRIGGLEKEDVTGEVSYDPENHEKMVKLREEKINKLAGIIPPAVVDTGNSSGDVLILAWGSSYGVIKSVVRDLVSTGHAVSHVHLTWINPFPANLHRLLKQFRTILIPEINKGQLIRLVRDKFLVDAIGYNKIQGTPFTEEELKGKILSVLSS